MQQRVNVKNDFVKKLLSTSVVTLMIFASFVVLIVDTAKAVPAGTNEIMVSPSSTYVTIGDTFWTDILLNVTWEIDNITITNVTFQNPGLVNYTSTAQGDFFTNVTWMTPENPSGYQSGGIYNSSGYALPIVWVNDTGVNMTNATIANITWLASGVGSANIKITGSTYNTSGLNMTVTTINTTVIVHPTGPSSFSTMVYNDTQINLTFSHGADGDNITIIRKIGLPPNDITDGTEICNTTATSYEDTGLMSNVTYWYRAWSWNNTASLFCLDSKTATDMSTTWGLFNITFTGEYPYNNSWNIPLTQSTVNVTIKDGEGDKFNWSIEVLGGASSSTDDATNGSKECTLTTPLTAGTNYSWWVNVTDGNNTANLTYYFTTTYAPTQSGETPVDDSSGHCPVPALYVKCFDNDSSDVMNVTWWSNSSNTWVQFDSNTNVTNTTNITQTNLNFSNPGTKYWWSVNITDGNGAWSNTTYNFTTNYAPTLSGQSPIDGATDVITSPDLYVICSDTDSDTMTATWRSNSSGPWVDFETNSSISTGENITQPNSNFSDYNTKYWWSVNLTDGCNWTNATYSMTTQSNNAPTQSGESPVNGSSGISTTPELYVICTDIDSDTMTATWRSNSSGTWDTFETNSSISTGENITQINSNFTNSGIKYWWSVNLTDGFNWTNATYSFTTSSVPIQSDESPTDGSTNICPIPELYVNCSDNDGSTLNATWWSNSTGAWAKFGSNETDFASGTNITQTNSNFSNPGQIYYWSVNLTDGGNWTNTTYSFTTNYAPTLNGESPTDWSNNSNFYPSCHVIVSDPDGDTMNVDFYEFNSTGAWIHQQTTSSVSSGTNVSWSNYSNVSSYSTTYNWSVNVTDGCNWTNATYNFTTRSQYLPDPPTSLTVTSTSTTSIGLSWTKGTNADATYIEWNSIETWNKGEGNYLYNDTGEAISHTNLNHNTKYYYQAWSWNSTGNLWSLTSDTVADFTDDETSGSGPGPDDDDDDEEEEEEEEDTTTETSEETLDEINDEYGLDLEDPFYANDTDGDGIPDTFIDPNGVLTPINNVNISGENVFLLSTDDDEIPEFFWNTDDDTITPITHAPGTTVSTETDTVNETVTVTVNITKADWVYIDVTDDYPDYNITIKTTDGREITSDMIWREDGKIYVLDDPAIEYLFIYGYSIIIPIFNPLTGETFETAKPTITITYEEEVEIISATFGSIDILDQITSTDNMIFTFTPLADLDNGQYTLSVTAEDSEDNILTTSASYTIDVPSVGGLISDEPEDELPILWIVIIIVLIIFIIVAYLFKSGYLYIEDEKKKESSETKKKSTKKKK